MTFVLPELPFGKNDLAPHISARTLEFHHGKHHQGYVNNLNKLIEGTESGGRSLPEIIKSASGGVYNNAAQIWNHTFYWYSLSPRGGGEPEGALGDAIKSTFGSTEAFRSAFQAKAGSLFGSGWTWLVKNKDGSLAIQQTHNADNPLKSESQPLFTLDVWEHAYYLDYQNARPKYAQAFWNLVNWEFANANFTGEIDIPGTTPC